jgi:hypothetical protein
MLARLDDSIAGIKEKFAQPIQLYEEDILTLVEVNKLGAVVSRIISVGNSLSIIMGMTSEARQEMTTQANNICLVTAKLSEMAENVADAMMEWVNM